jgi:hypothetical protein
VLGPLGSLFLVIAGIGLILPILPAYWTWAPTERYETDYATLLLFSGLAAWLALSKGTSGYRRRMLRVGGGLLAAWGCATGFAIGFYGSDTALSVTHPAMWRTLEDIGSPVSTALAAAVGHPVIGIINAQYASYANEGYTALGTNVSQFSLTATEHAGFTVVSPDSQNVILSLGVSLRKGSQYGLRVDGPGGERASYSLPPGGGPVQIPVKLGIGLNRVTLSPIATPQDHPAAGTPVMLVFGWSLASGG